MKNITLSVEEDVLQEARKIAAERNTTVNAIVRVEGVEQERHAIARRPDHVERGLRASRLDERIVRAQLLERGDPLFGRTTPEHNAPTRRATEFRNAGRFRDQELHIAVVDHVTDLIGAEHGMDRNKDRVGPKHPQDRNDLIECLLHADADAVTRSDPPLGEGLGRRHGLGVELPERQRFAPAENSGLAGDGRQRLLELCGYRRHLSGGSYLASSGPGYKRTYESAAVVPVPVAITGPLKCLEIAFCRGLFIAELFLIIRCTDSRRKP